ncbi:ATP-binding cassette domain-containing protein [Alsobacter sp. R-9]
MLEIRNVSKHYPGRRGTPGVDALKDVSLSVARRESFGLVGESGSGKTTLTRCVLGLEAPTAGRIVFDGVDIATLSPAAMRALRARIQIVFQDPYASLNPRMTAHDIVAEPMIVHRDLLRLDGRRRSERVAELFHLVGLGERHLHRFPHEFSGGQRQRIGIARALAVNPEFLVLDEPTSALDVSVQAQVLNLLHDLQERLSLTYLFISHDLGVIRAVCDRVALIHRGRIVEEGATEQVFERPASDYARMLIGAMPDPDPDRSPFRT